MSPITGELLDVQPTCLSHITTELCGNVSALLLVTHKQPPRPCSSCLVHTDLSKHSGVEGGPVRGQTSEPPLPEHRTLPHGTRSSCRLPRRPSRSLLLATPAIPTLLLPLRTLPPSLKRTSMRSRALTRTAPSSRSHRRLVSSSHPSTVSLSGATTQRHRYTPLWPRSSAPCW
jgi:hypothetical protein